MTVVIILIVVCVLGALAAIGHQSDKKDARRYLAEKQREKKRR